MAIAEKARRGHRQKAAAACRPPDGRTPSPQPAPGPAPAVPPEAASSAGNAIARFWFVPVLAAYAALVVYTVGHHEPWFDEAQSWLIARDCSLSTLFSEVLRYEGHPALWYLILKVAVWCGLPYEGVGLLGAAIAVAGVGLFLWMSPFPKLLTALLPFTYFLAYQYAVIARSYVLLPLLLFAVATLARRKWEQPVRWGIVVLLLANVSAHAFLMAGGIMLVHVVELAARWRNLEGPQRKRHLGMLAMVAAGALLVVLMLWPASDCVATTGLNGAIVLSSLRRCATYAVTSALFENWPATITLLAASCYWFWRTGVLGLFLAVWLPVLALFCLILVAHHHHGILLVAWLFVMWCSLDAFAALQKRGAVDRPLRLAWWVMMLLTVGLVGRQATWTAYSVAYETAYPYCGARALAGYLKAHDLTKHRIGAVHMGVASVLPYFPRNIFINFPNKSGLSYVDWHASFHGRYAAFAAQKCLLEPCDAIVWPNAFDSLLPSRIGDSFQSAGLAPAWRIIGYFPGRMICKDRFTDDQGYLLIVRAELADRLGLPAADETLAAQERRMAQISPRGDRQDQEAAAMALTLNLGSLLRKVDPPSAAWQYQAFLTLLEHKRQDKDFFRDRTEDWDVAECLAHNNIGAMLFDSQPEAALEHFRAAARLDASQPDVHINIGAILARSGKLPEAAVAYQAALRLDRHNAKATRALQYINSRLPVSTAAAPALPARLYR